MIFHGGSVRECGTLGYVLQIYLGYGSGEERPMLNTKSSWCDARCPGMKSPNLGQTPFSQSYSHRSAGHGESGDGGNFEGTRGDWRWTGAQNLDSTTSQLTAQNPTDQREAILKGCTFFFIIQHWQFQVSDQIISPKVGWGCQRSQGRSGGEIFSNTSVLILEER